MRTISKTLKLVLAAVLLVLVTGPVASGTALASPHPFPMPFMAADYGGHLPPISHATRHSLIKRTRRGSVNLRSIPLETKRDPSSHTDNNKTTAGHGPTRPSVHSVPVRRPIRRQSSADPDALLEQFSGNNDSMSSSANNIRKAQI